LARPPKTSSAAFVVGAEEVPAEDWRNEKTQIEAGDMVDLVGIEPTTSSMPWKRAPSCATGPRLKIKNQTPDESGSKGSSTVIFAHITGIVNARDSSVSFHRHLLP
jgi:hypothetical protein